MKTQHSNAPWTFSKPHGMAHYNIKSGQMCIANVFGFVGSVTLMDKDGEGDGNARLIASAPELLAALEHAQDLLKAFGSPIPETIRAAIAKAKGEA